MLRSLTKSLSLSLCCALAITAQTVGGFGFDPRGGQLTQPASNTPPEKRCVLAGHVVNALTGEPVKRVNLRLTVRRPSVPGNTPVLANGGMSQQGYAASSEADGTFRIEGIEPGSYGLSGNKSGFLSANYGAKRLNQSGTTVTLSPGQQLTDITLSIMPQSVISGKVTDPDGDPVNGGMVQVVWQTWQRGKLHYLPRNSGQINDLGEYRIASMSPGKYYLAVQQYSGAQAGTAVPGKPDIRPIRTFYPGVTALSSATMIEVKAGQDLTGMDIRMQTAQTYHIRGKVAGELPDAAAAHASVNVSPRDEGSFAFFGGGSSVKPDGSFDIAGIAPGSYVVNFFVLSGQVRSAAHQNVDVGAGDVDGVMLVPTAPGSMRGVVRIEGTPQGDTKAANTSNLHINFFPSEFNGMMGPPPNVKMAEDGSFTINNVNPGKYIIQANAPTGTYVKSIRYGSSEILGKELDLSGGAGGEIEVVYRYGPGEVDGTIQQPQGAANNGNTAQNAPSAQILLVPDTLNADGSGIRMGSTDNSGTFTLKGVPPGHYHAYAVEDSSLYSALQNPDVLKQLEQKATDVDIKENDKKQIQLPVLSSDELQQLLARAGITLDQ